MGGMILMWSIIVIAYIGAKNYAGILVLGFLLGMAEAGISPCSGCPQLLVYEKEHSLIRDSYGDYFHVLQALRTASAHDYLVECQRHGNHGASPAQLWPWTFPQYGPS